MLSMFNQRNVLELINNCLNNAPFSQKEGIFARLWQNIFHPIL